MKLLWHIAAKDLRRLWPIILTFAALIVTKLLIGVVLWRHTGPFDFEWFDQMRNYVLLAQVMEAIVGFVLVAAIAQTDSLIGTRAFWMTRPISGGQLLAAKTLTMGLTFGLLPLVLTLPWWLYCGFGLTEIGRAAWPTLAPHLAVALLAWPIAALTRSFQRFVLWSILGLVFVQVVALYGMVGMLPKLPALPAVMLAEWLPLAMCFATLGVIAVLVHQYWTRRLLRSVGIYALGILLVITLPWFLSWRWIRQAPRKVGVGAGSALVDTVKIEQFNVRGTARRSSRQEVRLPLTVQVSGLPKGCMLGNGRAQLQLTETDGTRLDLRSSLQDLYSMPTVAACEAMSLPIPQPDLELRKRQAKWRGLIYQVANPKDASVPAAEFVGDVRIPNAAANRYLTAAPRAAIDAQFDLLQLEPCSESPWQTGSTVTDGSLQVRIADAQLAKRESLILEVVWRYPKRDFTPKFAQQIMLSRSRKPGVLALVNQTQGNLSVSRIGGGREIWIAGAAISWEIQMFWPHQHRDAPTEKLVPDADWFGGAKLVLLGLSTVETFTRHLEVPALTIPADAATPTTTKR